MNERKLGRLGLLLITALSVSLYYGKLQSPSILMDDFDVLRDSRDWASTWQNLFRPHNEHMSPLLRLVSYALLHGGGLRHIGLSSILFSLGLLVGSIAALYRFLRNEGIGESAALVATAVFGVSPLYYEAVGWYSPSFESGALLFTLLGFLAVERAVDRERALDWLWVAGAAFLAASSFSTGIVAAVLLPLHAWLRSPGTPRRRLADAALAWPGFVVYLAVYAVAARPLMERLPHYGGQSVYQTADLAAGLANTARALVDVGLLGNLGLLGKTVGAALPAGLCVLVTLTLAVLALWATARRRLLGSLALGFLLGGYLLIYTFRNFIPYPRTVWWGRYHLFAQAGWALLIALALDRPWAGWRRARAVLGSPGGVAGAVALVFALHVGNPRLGENEYIYPAQRSQIGAYARLFERARVAGISEAALRERLRFNVVAEPPGFWMSQLYLAPAGATGDWLDFLGAAAPLVQATTPYFADPALVASLGESNRRLRERLGVGEGRDLAPGITAPGLTPLGDGRFSAGARASFVLPLAARDWRYLILRLRWQPADGRPRAARLAWSDDASFTAPAEKELRFVAYPADFDAVWDLDALPMFDRQRARALRLEVEGGGEYQLDQFTVR